MSNLIDLTILPMHDWKKYEIEGFRTRDAHLIQHFEKNDSVRKMLIVDRPITLPEMVLKRRYWRVRNGQVIKRKVFSSLAKVSRKIYVLDIFSPQILQPLILKRDWWDYIFRQKNIIREIKEAIKFLDLNNSVLFLWSPLSTGVIGRLDAELLVFDALDNWTKHPEMTSKRNYIEKGYSVIKEKADVIFANSKKTKKLLDNSRISPIFIPNGVDKECFRLSDKRIPADLKNIPKPIVGYAGKLAKRINVDMLLYAAHKLPAANFVLIGQFLDKKWFMPLRHIKNVHFLGDKHHNSVPYYLSEFDVCVIPHNVGPFECDGDAIKLYEYLAAGKPVVTTNILGVDVFKDVIDIVNTKEAFVERLAYWIGKAKDGTIPASNFKDSISKSFFWSEKADIMINTIIEKMQEKYR